MLKGITIPILQKGKLSLRELECLSQGQNRDQNPEYLAFCSPLPLCQQCVPLGGGGDFLYMSPYFL